MTNRSIQQHSEQLKSLLNETLVYCCPTLKTSVSIAPGRSGISAQDNSELGHIMLTVSGLDFRATIFLHYQTGTHAKQAYALLHGEEKNDNGLPSDAFYTELGNHICGRIKSYFHQDFPHLGMSTPWIMSPTTELVDLATPELTGFGQFFFCFGSIPILGSSLYVYSSQPLTFRSQPIDANDQHASGELEFF